MLLYSNKSWLRLLLETKGSVLFQKSNIFLCSFLATVCLLLQIAIEKGHALAPRIPNSYGMAALGTVVAFAIVFRANLAWQRYWDACSQLVFMYSKWEDTFTQFSVFAHVTIDKAKAVGGYESDKKIKHVQFWQENVEKHFSILSAVACDRIAHGHTARMDKRVQTASWRHQVAFRTDVVYGEDLTGATTLPEMTSMKGETSWSQCLDAVWKVGYAVVDKPTAHEQEALEKSRDRVNMVMNWILMGLAEVSSDLAVAPPIQSRMFQELSNGMLGFWNAVKIADVPFPFPYAQLLTLIVLVYICFIPVFVVCFTQSYILGPLITYFLAQSIWCINQVAKELENPFGLDSNDISLAEFHARFMDTIRELGVSREAFQKVVQKKKDSIATGGDLHNSRASPSMPSSAAALLSAVIGHSAAPKVVHSVPLEDDANGINFADPDRIAQQEALRSAGASAGSGAGTSKEPASSGSTSRSQKDDPISVSNKPDALTSSAKERSATANAGNEKRPEPQSRDSGAEQLLSRQSKGMVEVFDRQLEQIGERMERHLGRIAEDLDAMAKWAKGSSIASFTI